MATGRPQQQQQQLLLLLCAVTSVAFGSTLGRAGYPICRVSCCDVQPSCNTANHVICDCPDLSSMTLRKGDLPESLQSIKIRIGTQLAIHAEAFQDLTSLSSVQLDLNHSGTLEIESAGLALAENNSLNSVLIKNVKSGQIASSAFAGFWNNIEIRLNFVEWLKVRQSAFNWESRRQQAPSLILDKVQDLQLHPGAIESSIKHLELRDVNMTSCASGSIGGHIFHLLLSRVTVQDYVHTDCIKGSGRPQTISVRSCNFGIIESLGISGRTGDLDIRDTNIASIHENGLNLRVRSLSIKLTRFRRLASNGLNVTADSIHLEKVRIDVLKKHGLAALHLRVNEQTSKQVHPMRIENLVLSETEKGSLGFAKGVTPSFHHLEVSLPDPPICPTEKWVRWLVRANENDQSAPLERELLGQLQRLWLCPKEADETISDLSTTDHGSYEKASTTEGRINELEVADAASLDGKVVENSNTTKAVVSASVILLAIIVLLIYVCRRKITNRDRRGSGITQHPCATTSGENEPHRLGRLVTVSDGVMKRRRGKRSRKQVRSSVF